MGLRLAKNADQFLWELNNASCKVYWSGYQMQLWIIFQGNVVRILASQYAVHGQYRIGEINQHFLSCFPCCLAKEKDLNFPLNIPPFPLLFLFICLNQLPCISIAHGRTQEHGVWFQQCSVDLQSMANSLLVLKRALKQTLFVQSLLYRSLEEVLKNMSLTSQDKKRKSLKIKKAKKTMEKKKGNFLINCFSYSSKILKCK